MTNGCRSILTERLPLLSAARVIAVPSSRSTSDHGRLSSRLAGLPITSIYTSPLLRASATARILAESHGIKPTVLDDLTEIHNGEWQGLHKDEINRKCPEVWDMWRKNPAAVTIPGGENLVDVTDRAVRAFTNVVNTQQEKRCLIVTHEVIIKVLIAHVLQASNNIYRRFRINNASLSIIEAVNNSSLVTGINDVSHLEI